MARMKLPSQKANVSPKKAKAILSDGTVRGNPLTQAQRGLFGAIAGSATPPRAKTQLQIGQRPRLGARTKAAVAAAKPKTRVRLPIPPRVGL